jgi:hypothetical protein
MLIGDFDTLFLHDPLELFMCDQKKTGGVEGEVFTPGVRKRMVAGIAFFF